MLYIPCPFKRCKNCLNDFLPSKVFFYRHGHRLDAHCKQCRNQINRNYAEAHPEVIKRSKRNYLENHPERRHDSVQRYRETHKQECANRIRDWKTRNWPKVLEQAKHRYWLNPDLHRQRARAYPIKYPEKAKQNRKLYWSSERGRIVARIHQSKRRARRKNAEGQYTPEDIQKQVKFQKGRCYYCGKKFGKKYHIDHAVPLSRGGSNGPDNIVIACPHCNDSKGAKLPHEWPEGGRLL